jgi:hypothetical protein
LITTIPTIPVPVGARLAREGDLTVKIIVECEDVFAGKPRSYRDGDV